jgi:hypothetical protein
MTTPLNRLARHLLTDLEQTLNTTCSAEQERQAIHLITEAFTVAVPLIGQPLVHCPYCEQLVADIPNHCLTDCTVVDQAVKQIVGT